ncbi:ribonuclease T2 family protein [Basfia succiniciproducens]|uniref:ribonuclease T2 family protein n=1 Tax=Basfia succiniciproducens TaxID=653940 RepID=UPI0008D169FF|nr:ribonuclease [Basfia succiniciproducens]SEQ10149.1 ribonuclease T2 [Basfia succiniciproducens]
MQPKFLLLKSLFYIIPLALTVSGCFDKTAEKLQETPQKSTALSTQESFPPIKNNYDFAMKDDKIGQNLKANVDYYMLALSWSPSFCRTQYEKYGNNLPDSAEYQCGIKKKYGWVIHGLWPQSATARTVAGHPRLCKGDLPQVEENVVRQYMAESPSPNLLQAEWEKHGACAFDRAEQYFAKQQTLYRTLTLPTVEMKGKELFSWLRKNNPQLRHAYLGASRDELYICYDLNWQVINCPKQ